MNDPECFCGGRSYTRVMLGVHTRGDAEEPIEFDLVACQNCGLRRTLPVPDEGQYAARKEEMSFDSGTGDVWSDLIINDVARWKGEGAFLDVGCNTGNLVELAVRRGFDARGIDLDPVAISEGIRRGRPVACMPVSEVEGSFDVIVLNHVLEHVVELRAFVADLGRLLASEGYLFVQVPYHLGLIPRLMGDHWLAWLPTLHVWQFTPSTLRYVFEEGAGLHAVSVTTKGAIEPRSPGLKGKAKRVLAVSSQRIGWGDEIEAIICH